VFPSQRGRSATHIFKHLISGEYNRRIAGPARRRIRPDAL